MVSAVTMRCLLLAEAASGADLPLLQLIYDVT
jgi:hypothetical protein